MNKYLSGNSFKGSWAVKWMLSESPKDKLVYQCQCLISNEDEEKKV